MSALYVTEHGATIGVVNERIQIRRKQKIVHEMPLVHLDRVIMMVPAYITAQAVRLLMDRGIDITYLSKNGKFYGQFTRGDGVYVQLRLAQFQKFYDKNFRLGLAKCFVGSKISNMIALWRRQRQRSDMMSLVQKLDASHKKVTQANNPATLLGLEGSATAMHFRLLRGALQGNWKFSKREHHPPPDPINAMLSLGYTLLYSKMTSLLQIHGLDPYLGFFHEPKRGHAALASDLIEEWRCPVVDALVLRLANTQQITPSDFTASNRNCTMNRTSLQKYTEAFEKRLQSFKTVENASTDPVGGLEGQVRQLARVLIGKQKSYIAMKF